MYFILFHPHFLFLFIIFSPQSMMFSDVQPFSFIFCLYSWISIHLIQVFTFSSIFGHFHTLYPIFHWFIYRNKDIQGRVYAPICENSCIVLHLFVYIVSCFGNIAAFILSKGMAIYNYCIIIFVICCRTTPLWGLEILCQKVQKFGEKNCRATNSANQYQRVFGIWEEVFGIWDRVVSELDIGMMYLVFSINKWCIIWEIALNYLDKLHAKNCVPAWKKYSNVLGGEADKYQLLAAWRACYHVFLQEIAAYRHYNTLLWTSLAFGSFCMFMHELLSDALIRLQRSCATVVILFCWADCKKGVVPDL